MPTGQQSGIKFMASGTEFGNGFSVLGVMGIMASAALPINRRRMPDPALPEGVDLVAVEAKRRLFL